MAWTLIIILIIILAILVLPLIMKAVLNNALQEMEGYTGRIDRLRINLFKSKVSFHSICIRRDSDPDYDRPLLLVPTITIFFKWKQLLRKMLDLSIVVDKPQVLFIAEKSSLSEDEGANNSPRLPSPKNSIEKLLPFRIGVDVRGGRIRYVNSHSSPQLDITVTDVDLTIRDLSNRALLSNTCNIVCTGFSYEGTTNITATLLPLEPTLTFDLELELKSINLVLLNHLLREYVKVDVSKGTLNLYAEVAVRDNSFKGYIKPLLKDLNFTSSEDREDSIFQKVWERIVAGFYNVLKNNRNNQVATKIPIEGRLDDPDVRVTAAILGMLRNAFVKALKPSLDHDINIKSSVNPGKGS